MITQASDFKAEFQIPNVTDTAPNSDLLGNASEIVDFIEKYETECLLLTLGYELYTELKPELLKLPFTAGASSTADDKWIDLVNGKAQYKGIRGILKSYIFFYFLRNDESHYSGVGVNKERAKGARQFSPRTKAVNAWREFYRLTDNGVFSPKPIVRQVIGVSGIGYGVDFYGKNNAHQSLYGFLKENRTVYPNAVMSRITNMNYHGI